MLSTFYPTPKTLHQMSGLDYKDGLEHLLTKPLLDLITSFLEHPGKNIRPKLVKLGYHLAAGDDAVLCAQRLETASSIIESIHAGALIVDDIQDGSLVRRDQPTLHLQHGIPKALNAGNWLYFWGLMKIKDLNLSPECASLLMHDCHDLIMKAHVGQALDIGTAIDAIDQEHIKNICFASMRLKTGTLMSLALRLGGCLGNASKERMDHLDDLGMKLGEILQMFDDAGNFLQAKKDVPSKRHEDLRLRRPTWVWATVSELPSDDFAEFSRCVSLLPDENALNEFSQKRGLRELLLDGAKRKMESLIKETQETCSSTHPQSLKTIQEIASQLEKAYV
jgi:geranylgeranyl pyrophosphate synthase